MKYRLENRPEDFEFHDALFSLIHADDKKWIMSAKHLNSHKNTEQNPTEFDMEIDEATITFTDVSVSVYKAGGDLVKDINGNTRREECILLEGTDAKNKFLAILEEPIIVLYFGTDDNARYILEGCGTESFFTVEFNFENIIVEWNGYCKKAWYELQKQYTFDITLNTRNNVQKNKITILCDEESIPAAITVYIKYQNKDYLGCGNDSLWVDAFADLQKKLPTDVTLKCCLSCRHGNMCPVGNQPNELFCTKDVHIAQKSDLFFYTEDYAEREKRSKKYTDVCANYQPQSEDCYTYTDYLYYLAQHNGVTKDV